MIEIFDVIVITAVAVFTGFYKRSIDLKLQNAAPNDLSDRQKLRQQRLQKKQPWEITAAACGLALGIFILWIFNAATNFSHYHFIPRLLVTLAVFIVLILILQFSFVFIVGLVRKSLSSGQ